MPFSYDQVQAISQNQFLPLLADNVFTSNVAWIRMEEFKEYEDGGPKILQPLIHAKGTAESYSGYQVLDTTANEEFTAAEFERRHYHRAVVISRDEELKNMGPAQIVSLVEAKIKNAEVNLRDKFGDDLYSDGGATSIDGFADIVSATSTYGGIAVADMPTWVAVSTSISGNVALDDVAKLIDDLTIGQDRPSILITRAPIYRRILSLMQSQQRFGDGKEAKDVWYGFTGVMFYGIPLVWDHKCPSGELYALNLNWVHWRPHREEEFRADPWVKPTNQNVHVMNLFTSGNITTSQRRMQGKLTGITE